MNFFTALPVQVQVIAAFLMLLTLLFVWMFLVPGILFRLKVGRVLARLQDLKATNKRDPGEVKVFDDDETLKHLWQEYQDTIHEQKTINPATGVQEVVAYRSTVPAEVFFSSQALVDSRLRTEFFKHLPGIFTGLGIIGTFLGLLQGLQAFHISEDTQLVRQSLEGLLHGVFDAFLVSATAISLAMLMTFVEKWTTSGLYRKVEKLTFLLDGMFESGAGEEYLARLVTASESSASQTKILKDALVSDLKQVLSELTERQIAASASGNQQLGAQIVESLQTGLREPLDRISGAVAQIGGSQSDAIGRVLTDSIAALTQRMQELFGGQISGINELQQQTIQALQTAVTKLEQMAANVDSAGQHATEAMSSRLTDALGAMEARQQVMNNQMAEFVGQIRNLIAQSQTETNQKLQETLTQLGDTVTQMVGTLKVQAEQAGQAHVERERRITDNTTQAVSSLGGQVETVLAKVTEVSAEIGNSVRAMQAVTTDAITRMNSGAEVLYVASSDFAKAGQAVTGVLTQATNISDKLLQSAGAINTSTRTLESVVADYKATRETLAAMLTELGRLVDSAKREAALTDDVLSRIEGATAKLVEAQVKADTYMEGISAVLGEAHEAFADNMEKTLGQANRQFYEQISTATALLRSAIEELEATLSSIGPKK
jgi:hypothetical protein